MRFGTRQETQHAKRHKPMRPPSPAASAAAPATRGVVDTDIVAVIVGESGTAPGNAWMNPVPGFHQDPSTRSPEMVCRAAWTWNVFDDGNLYTCVASDDKTTSLLAGWR